MPVYHSRRIRPASLPRRRSIRCLVRGPRGRPQRGLNGGDGVTAKAGRSHTPPSTDRLSLRRLARGRPVCCRAGALAALSSTVTAVRGRLRHGERGRSPENEEQGCHGADDGPACPQDRHPGVCVMADQYGSPPSSPRLGDPWSPHHLTHRGSTVTGTPEGGAGQVVLAASETLKPYETKPVRVHAPHRLVRSSTRWFLARLGLDHGLDVGGCSVPSPS